MLMLWFWYFWMIRAVSSSVLNEFIKMNGTLTPYAEFKCYKVSIVSFTSRHGAHLNLPDGQVEESHALPNFNDTLGTNTSHSSTKTTI
jgi:hypothetical protein